MSRYPQMTRQDRQQRRERVLAAYVAGESPRQIAARFGVSQRYVNQIAQAAGVTMRPFGRPAVWPDCPDHLRREYLYLRRFVPSTVARAELERAA